MTIPPGVSKEDFSKALNQFERIVGSKWVFSEEDEINLYRDAYSPLWDEKDEIIPSAAVAPDDVEQVSAIVKVANQYRIPIFPISTGKNLGYGGSAPNLSGSVVVDLKRMNRVLEVDDRRHFAIVEPGVSYFDLYNYIQERGLKLWIDCPDPGWGSLVGNSLDHGVGYTYGNYRDHFNSHCGMEVVLPNGEVMRTGMGALPGAETWAEYRYGFGPTVDGLFAQGNFGIVTKMGFWLMPEPEAYISGYVSVPKHEDIIPMVDKINYLEHVGLIGHPRYGSPMSKHRRDPAVANILRDPISKQVPQLESWGKRNDLGVWHCELQYYGPEETVQANWDYSQRLLSEIPGAKFTERYRFKFPMPREQMEGSHLVSFGIPNLEIFMGGARSSTDEDPWDGHFFFSPVIPKSGEAVIKAQEVFRDVFEELDLPPQVSAISSPSTWMYRTFIFIMGLDISRSNQEHNQNIRKVAMQLIKVAGDNGWGEYRAPPVLQDAVMDEYSYNDHVLRRFIESLKDEADPNGIMAAGRGGIWPKHLRKKT
jgi:4-cresol dehydrogenase (hydroxylating)